MFQMILAQAAQSAAGEAEAAQMQTEQAAQATGGGGGEWTDPAFIMQMVNTYGLPVLKVLALLAVAWIVSAWAQRAVRGGMRRAKVDETLTLFISGTIRWLVVILALIMALSIFGFQTTSFAAILGAAGLAIGLAFQGTLSNMAAGIMLLLFRYYKVGDVVNIAGQLGKVTEIKLFTTTLDTFDNRHIFIPNGEIFGSVIENITYYPKRRVDVDVGVEYPADIDQTRAVLEKAAAGVPGQTDDEPQVVLMGLGGSSVDWQVRVWAASTDYLAIKQATIRAVKMALDEAGLGIPFPQMDVHLFKEDQDKD